MVSKKDKRLIALKVIPQRNTLKFKIVRGAAIDFDPGRGTIARAKAVCPCCGSGLTDSEVRRQFQEGKAGQRMVAVVLHHPDRQGKTYRLATERDLEVFQRAAEYVEKKRAELWDKWDVDPVPDEALVRVPVSFGVINVRVYGMNTWGNLFNARQKLVLITFAEKVRQAHEQMLAEGYGGEYARAVATYGAGT